MNSPSSRPQLRRWPGSWYGVATKSFVWGTPEFLLVVDREMFVERYRRLDFRDLLAVWIQPTRVRELWWVLSLSVLAVAAIGLWHPQAGTVWRIAGGVALVVGVLLGLLGAWIGPTCEVWLVSDVGPVRVRAWSRRKTFDRVWPRLQEHVATAQSGVPPLATVQQVLPVSPPALLTGSSAPSSGTPPSPRTVRFWLWSNVYSFWAAAVGWAWAAKGWTIRTAAVTGFLVLVCIVTSLASLLVTTSGKGLRPHRRWAGGALGINLVLWLVVYVLQMVLYVRILEGRSDDSLSSLTTLVIAASASVVSAIIGLVGAAILRRSP